MRNMLLTCFILGLACSSSATARSFESSEAYYQQRLEQRYAHRFVFGGGIQSEKPDGSIDGYASIGDVRARKFFLVRIGDRIPTAPQFRLKHIDRQHVIIEGRNLRIRALMMYHIARPEERRSSY